MSPGLVAALPPFLFLVASGAALYAVWLRITEASRHTLASATARRCRCETPRGRPAPVKRLPHTWPKGTR